MIRYTLACEAGHDFECWFPSSEACDGQIADGLVACPVCASIRVSKAIMAPVVARGGPAEPAAPVVSRPDRELREKVKALHAHLAAHSEHVGDRFAEEARRIHYGEAEGRSIHGQASLTEARALIEEGIDVAPLPVLPDDRN